MVFALAGDSTMTKPFANVPSMKLIMVSKLARMPSRQQAAIRWRQLSAAPRVTSRAVNEGRQHTLYFILLSWKAGVFDLFQDSQVMGRSQLIYEFAGRCHGDFRETARVRDLPGRQPSSALWLRSTDDLRL